MSELIPCPFCAGEARIFGMKTMSLVGCTSCGCVTAVFGTVDEAVEAWNRRVNDYAERKAD